MVFCNKMNMRDIDVPSICHNPYFNRWFSAMREKNYII